ARSPAGPPLLAGKPLLLPRQKLPSPAGAGSTAPAGRLARPKRPSQPGCRPTRPLQAFGHPAHRYAELPCTIALVMFVRILGAKARPAAAAADLQALRCGRKAEAWFAASA